MLAIMVAPAELWRAPADDAHFNGVDSNLMDARGDVRIAYGAIDMISSETSPSSVTLLTTPRRRLTTSLQIAIVDAAPGVEPCRIGLWSPWTRSGYFVVFGPPPENEVKIETITNGQVGAMLTEGHSAPRVIGRYDIGATYQLQLLADRAAGYFKVAMKGPGVDTDDYLPKTQLPDIFGSVPLSLTASGDSGSGHVALRDYHLTLLHERSYGYVIDDPVAKSLTLILTLAGLLVILAAFLRLIARRKLPERNRFRSTIPPLVGAACLLYLAGNALLFSLGGHPFDLANEQLYAYVARRYGPVQLWFLPDVTSAQSTAWNGTPWIQAAFPYEALTAYFYTAVGWLGSVVLAGGGVVSRASVQLGYVIKSVDIVFGLLDAGLIYALLRQLRVNELWSGLGFAFFAFNPAVWFSTSVWGQTHVFSIAFILAAILFAERRMPIWAWLALAAGLLTRPQMLVFGLLIGVVLLKKFTWRENLRAVSWTVIVTFTVLSPLTLALSPSLPVDILLNNFHVQEAGGNQPSLTTVSQSAYSIWPLVTYAVHGASSVQRAYTPSASLLVGSVSYQTMSQIVTVIAMAIVSLALLLKRRSDFELGGYLPLVTLGVVAFFMLLTGVVATHFLLALPLILLCRRWMSGFAYCFAVAAWSVSTFVPMYGDMGLVVSSQAYPLFAPDHNVVTRFFVALYAWDRFITVAIVANLCAMALLAVSAVRQRASAARLAPA